MTPAAPRPVTQVAVGVLLRDDGRVLLADRPAGKAYAGHWEFPGGKIEPGEAVAQALERELHEELGIDIGPSAPWLTFEFDYPHAYVRLQFRLVGQWRGEPQAREGQRLRFVDPACELPQPLLPAAVPALRWLRLPREAVVIGSAQVAAWTTVPGNGAPMIVIDANWQAAGSTALLRAFGNDAGRRGRWLLACGAYAIQAEGADGVVLDAAALATAQPGARGWRGAWADTARDLRRASECGFDFVLVRSAELAGSLRNAAAPLPAFVPAVAGPVGEPAPAGHGRWTDLRGAGTENAPPGWA